jgi:hypothetical protein
VIDTLLGLLADAEVDTEELSARVAGADLRARTPKALRARIADELYRTVHQGARSWSPHPRDLVDPGLQESLQHAVPHTAVRARTRLAHWSEDGSQAVVTLGGVRVAVPRDRLHPPLPATATGSDVTVTLPPCRPALSPGFLSVVGSRSPGAGNGPVLRVYLHLSTGDAAPALWGAVLRGMEADGLPYRAKILSHPGRYPRRDAMVVYVTDRFAPVVAAVSAAARTAPPGSLAEPVSPFTRRIAPGISVAWEPAASGHSARRMSFGQHRAGSCADALLDHVLRGTPLADALARAFRASGTDPALPYRNLDSPSLSL